MRSAVLIFVLLVVALVQGLHKIDAHAANKARTSIDTLIERQR